MKKLMFRLPLHGYREISGRYGDKRETSTHRGIDYVVDMGTPVLAAEDGEVVRAAFDVTRQASDGDYVVGDLLHPI